MGNIKGCRPYPHVTSAVVILSNAITSLAFIYIFGPVMEKLGNYTAAEQYSSYDFIKTFIVPYIVPSVLIIAYLDPVRKYFIHGNEKYKTAATRRVVNTPIVMSFLSITGWVVAYFIVLSEYGFAADGTSGSMIFHLVMRSVSFIAAGMLCFIISYFTLDLLNQNHYLPIIFEDKKMFGQKGFLYLRIRMKFFIYFFAVAVVPSGILTIGIAIALIYPQYLPRIFLLHSILTVSSIYVTVLISNSFRIPLERMKKVTALIRSGDFNGNVVVSSCDEIGALAYSVNDMVAGLRDKEIMKDAFGKIVDPSVRDHLLKGNVELGGVIANASVLFSDIRNFTSLSEKMQPDAVVRMLNLCFGKLSRTVSDENGMVNKYIGDAVMAVFGVPVELEYHADSAVRSAISMQKELAALNLLSQEKEFPSLTIGIGIHSGDLLAGNIGSELRMEYTVIGDNVNLASRIESLTKEYGSGILISDVTFRMLKDSSSYSIRFVDKVKVKGREEDVGILEVMDYLPDEELSLRMSYKAEFERAVNYFHCGDMTVAMKTFKSINGRNGPDLAVAKYISKIESALN